MKLAEAPVLRADVQKRIEQLRNWLRQSVIVQEGETPPEDPAETADRGAYPARRAPDAPPFYRIHG